MCLPLVDVSCLPCHKDTVLLGKTGIVMRGFILFVNECANVWISPIFPLSFYLFSPFSSPTAGVILEAANVSDRFFSGITIAVGL